MSYAVIKTGGKQYRVMQGDVLRVELLTAEEGATVSFDQVLLVGSGESVTVGAPIVEGATVYLPVSVPGALLYVGDGHAAQGDGELNGNALETSMDVEFTVGVVSHKPLMNPRVESATHIMAMGLAGSLDDAFRAATANMAQWLADGYKLTPSEIAQVLGTAAEYKVSEAADRNAGIVLKIAKERLQPLTVDK